MAIKETDTIEDLLDRYPDIGTFLRQYGIVCVLCGEPVWDTLGNMIRQKGLDPDRTMAEINEKFPPDS